jgi:UDP-N-acetyl-D-glucosamine dehydrogenase
MNMENISKTVAVIGLGYVGLPLALLASEKGYKVIGIDINKDKVDCINSHVSPFCDEDVSSALKTTKMTATSDISCLKDVDIIVICVPTPVYENRLPNYEPVESACKSIGLYLKKGQLVILESTVNPGVCDEMVIPILEEVSGLKKSEFGMAFCPERINPGDSKWNVSNIPRVVGGVDKSSLERAVEFYRSVISAEIKPMGSLKEAEATKVVENSFRNVNIAFVNELAMAFDKLGIDVVNVIDGAATKPFSFMAHYPGCGIGGHCIPVDPYYLIDYSLRTSGFEHSFLKLACQTNADMPRNTIALLEEGLSSFGLDINKSKIAVLGMSYKANIDDCRESPSFEIVELLKKLGATVFKFDPYVLRENTHNSVESILMDSDAIIVATSHNEFINLSTIDFVGTNVKVIIDGRNCLDKKQFLESTIYYKGIGR